MKAAHNVLYTKKRTFHILRWISAVLLQGAWGVNQLVFYYKCRKKIQTCIRNETDKIKKLALGQQGYILYTKEHALGKG